MNDSLRQFAERTSQIYRVTKHESIRTYLEFIRELEEHKSLPFIMQGNLQWKTGDLNGVCANGIWLGSNLYDPVGKHIMANPVRNYLQMHCNTYELIGKIDGEFVDADLTSSRIQIEAALHKLYSVRNAFSLLLGVSLAWYPARYLKTKVISVSAPPEEEEKEEWQFVQLPRSQEEQTSTVIGDEHVERVLDVAHRIDMLGQDLGSRVLTALDWHSEGQKLSSGLNRFVNLWATIELIAHYFYKNADAGVVGRKNQSEKKKEVCHVMEENSRSVLDRVMAASRVIEPTAREKMRALFAILPNATGWENDLFTPGSSERSLYQIRNDIAHGNVSEGDFETVAGIKERLHDMSVFSRKFLIAVLENADTLESAIN